MKRVKILSIPVFVFMLLTLAAADNQSQAFLDELKMLNRIFVGPASSENQAEAKKLYGQGMESHRQKKYLESEKLWYMAAKADPKWLEPFFNLACSTAMQGKHEIAIEYLEIALNMDRNRVLPWARNDSDLAGLRKNEKYIRLLEKYDPKNHWVTELLGKTFVYEVRDSWNTDRREIKLYADGSMDVKGGSSDTVPCDYTYTGGKWSVQGEGLIVIIYRKGGCADGGGPVEDSVTYTPASKDQFLQTFSGGRIGVPGYSGDDPGK